MRFPADAALFLLPLRVLPLPGVFSNGGGIHTTNSTKAWGPEAWLPVGLPLSSCVTVANALVSASGAGAVSSFFPAGAVKVQVGVTAGPFSPSPSLWPDLRVHGILQRCSASWPGHHAPSSWPAWRCFLSLALVSLLPCCSGELATGQRVLRRPVPFLSH